MESRDNIEEQIGKANEGKTTLEDMPVNQLNWRAQVLRNVIKIAQADGDERWRRLIPQQKRLNSALSAALRRDRERSGIPEPDSTVIATKPARLNVKRPGLSETSSDPKPQEFAKQCTLKSARCAKGRIETKCECGAVVELTISRDEIARFDCECGGKYGGALIFMQRFEVTKFQGGNDGRG